MAAETASRFYVRLNDNMARDVELMVARQRLENPGAIVRVADVVRSLIADGLRGKLTP